MPGGKLYNRLREDVYDCLEEDPERGYTAEDICEELGLQTPVWDDIVVEALTDLASEGKADLERRRRNFLFGLLEYDELVYSHGSGEVTGF